MSEKFYYEKRRHSSLKANKMLFYEGKPGKQQGGHKPCAMQVLTLTVAFNCFGGIGMPDQPM